MRHLFLVLTLAIATLSFTSHDKSGIRGVIQNAEGEPLIIATLNLYQNGKLIKSTESDFDGNFFFTDLDSGTYDLEGSYVGYQSKRVTDVLVKADSITELNFVLEEGAVLEEVVVVSKDKTKKAERKARQAMSSQKISALPSKNISTLAATTAGVTISSSDNSNIRIRGSRSGSTDYFLDGIRVTPEQIAMMVPKAQIDVLTETVVLEDSEPIQLPEAGQLTAGEWNDLKNWETWNELIATGVYQEMEEYWNRTGRLRQSMFVTNANNTPLANQKVELLSASGDVLWTAISDNSGSAELWLPSETLDYSIEVEGEKVTPNKSSENLDSYHLVVSQPCEVDHSIDVMFVVDVTSSMSDEIDYLRSELINVIERVETTQQGTEADIRLGTVFYKDHQDEIPATVSPLQSDLSASFEFMQTQSVGSTSRNRDTPEAVESGLELALAQDWNMSAANRIIFLVLDAPPRHQDDVITKINEQIQIAATMGIKIIPITASGIDRRTEYLMKQMAITTNGTYIFLTDDSGIGHAHLEHVVPDYEVELLNDLLVRVISGYAKSYDCLYEEPWKVRDIVVKTYPNPTSGQMTVKTDHKVDKLIVTSASGKSVLTIDDPEKELQLDLSQLIAGMYQLSVVVDGLRVETENVIKI